MCSTSCTLTDLVCNQTFTGSLRYGQAIKFGDQLSNPNLSAITLRSFSVIFTEQYDYNLSPIGPNFDWTQSVRDSSFIIPPNTLNRQVIDATNNYEIRAIPASRSFENLRINYDVKYQIGSLPEVTHRECAKYEITWCGDGILDTNIDTDLVTPGIQGEQCDPNDPSRS